MKSPVSLTLLGVLLGVLLGGVLGFALQTVVRGSGPGPPPSLVATDAGAPDALAATRASVDELALRIAALEAAVAGLRRPAGPEDAGAAEILAAVDELRLSLESRSETFATDLETLRAKYPETNWEAVHAVLSKWSVDEEGARKDMQLLSTREVLERFGPPTDMWSDEAGIHWVYGEGYDAVEDAYQTEMYLRMQDGYVTSLGVKN